MKPHTKLYLTAFGYTVADFIACEVCGDKAVDIHHIESRGMGGTKTKDTIQNLMAVCRSCHIKYGDKVAHLDFLKGIHSKVMADGGVK
jgi:ribosome-binding protein aMBF1 (putative translation factor)